MNKNFCNYFDDYTLKARIGPVFVVLLPFVFFVSFEFKILNHKEYILFFIGGILALFFLLGKIGRDLGVNKQEALYKKLGGKPTDLILSFEDNYLSLFTKKRYHEYLNEKIENINLPLSLEEEKADSSSMEKYRSAIDWLRSETRDKKKYPLVYGSLITYGFVRNLYGIKNIMIILYTIVLGIQIFTIEEFKASHVIINWYPQYVCFTVFISFIVIFIFLVTEKTLKRAAYSYAERILETCEKKGR